MITATFNFPDLAGAMEHARVRIGQELIVAMQTNRGLLFDAEGAYNGHKRWDDLNLRSGQILADRGVLKKSLAPGGGSGQPGPDGIARMNDGIVTIGTNVSYAAMMNWGTTKMPDGIMRPKNAKVLMIPLPTGKRAGDGAKGLKHRSTRITNKDGKRQNVIFVKYVHIPARRFDDITTEDALEFAEVLEATMAEVLREVAGG